MSNQPKKNTSDHQLPRRRFLQSGAAAVAGLWITSGYASGAESPNDKVNVACIGIGAQGRSNVNGVANQNIVALCDVDDVRAGDAYQKFPKAKKYYDFRQMLDELDNQIDAVTVSTPDHTHAHIAVRAMRMGKHCYCEKPMAHSVSEVRLMTEIAREKKLATQLGMQRHVKDNMHRVFEIVQSGVIGEVREVFCRMGGDRGMPDMPTQFPPVPEHLKWDLWLGPAMDRPYSPDYCPYNWRFWWDFGTGETGNWACHILDIPYTALKLGHPIQVTASGPPVDAQRTPKSLFSKIEFPDRGNLPPVTLHWCHTKEAIPEVKERNLPDFGNTLFIGSKGMLACDFDERKLYPEDQFADFKGLEKFYPDSPGFHREWINAIRGGEPATCNFDFSGPMTEAALLANTSYRAGQGFDWDAKTMTAKGCPQADKYIRPEYREGWPL